MEGILKYFQITDLVKKDNEYIIFLEELNIYSEQYLGQKLTSKGFKENDTAFFHSIIYNQIKNVDFLQCSQNKDIIKELLEYHLLS